jgi:hypothetical protein
MKYLYTILVLSISLSAHSTEPQWHSLLDKDLSKWEVWMGIPHSSVKGLPKDTYVSDKIKFATLGRAMGLNNDPKKVFSIMSNKDEHILHISGEIFGGLSTVKSYQNYHLSMQVKWGEKKWPPSLDSPSNTGLLFHCQGDHGVMWLTWKACLEFEIMEGWFGYMFSMAGTSTTVQTNQPSKGQASYDPASSHYRKNAIFVKSSQNAEVSHGEWNTIELYTLDTRAIYVVNGSVVMAIEDAKDKYGQPLGRGQIQIQSEGAEAYYRGIKIRPISAFPKEYSQYLRTNIN